MLAEASDMQRGMKGPKISVLQNYLNKATGAGLVVDGNFGVKTEQAVQNFQQQYGIPVTGEVGSVTWQRIQSIAASVRTLPIGPTPNVPVVSSARSGIPAAGDVEWGKVILIGIGGIVLMKFLTKPRGRRRKGTSYFGMDVG